MNVKLIRPDNGQLSDIVAHAPGMVCLRTYDTVSRATRWYTLQDVQLCNPGVHVAGMQPQDFDSGLLYTCAEPPQPLTVVVTPDMAAAISHTAGVEIVVRKTVTVSLWHTAMRPAA